MEEKGEGPRSEKRMIALRMIIQMMKTMMKRQEQTEKEGERREL